MMEMVNDVFDDNCTAEVQAHSSSILANVAGVNDTEILNTESDIDDFFLS